MAVLAVLAGLVLLHGQHCADGMSAMPHGAVSVTSETGTASCASATMADTGSRSTTMLTEVCPAGASAGVVARAAGMPLGSGGMGGVLATCLAFIVAVVSTLLGLRPSWRPVAVAAWLSGRVVRIRAVRPRAPSLAELCLLRT
ncbi:hypothetical protein [Amycolatopsis saalfeldensis]|uniref:MYXO-CTERM domain-containing protein n=1 Tax=Amycolatopsis saalfeldensis TaxID=394193 RepID=A0A1H8YMP2_9PSEU|nr:hypothetical protein [Amycolatopsis saalfeldensis]SEP53343.1 hypothetical protein SAMN04489732_12667 [Amycolatopsis saalfeldensis]